MSNHTLISFNIRPSLMHRAKTLHQFGMGNLAVIISQITVQHLVMPPVHKGIDTFCRVIGAPLRPIGVLLRLQARFEDRIKHEQDRYMRYPVPYAGYSKGPELAGLLLRYHHMTHQLQCIGALLQFPRQFPDSAFHPNRLDIGEGLPLYPHQPEGHFMVPPDTLDYGFSIAVIPENPS